MWRLLFILGVAVFSVRADNSTPESTPGLAEGENAEKMVQNGNIAFTGRFLYEVSKINPNESSIMSPFSLFTPLLQLALYADGETLSQILIALNLPDKSHIRSAFPGFNRKLKAHDNVVLNIASRIFGSSDHPLSKNFLNEMRYVFEAEAETLNFKEPEKAADRINEWVENKTNHKIKDLAKPDMFDQYTRLVLANAIYFLGNWDQQFDQRFTRDRPFHLKNQKSVNVPTMYQKNYFKHGYNNELDCQVLEMFYKGLNYSFVIFLPNRIDGLSDMVEKLQDPQKFHNGYRSTEYKKVEVFIPNFKIESDIDLKPILRAIGIEDIFDEKKSILVDILEKPVPLYVSHAKQKAFCAVDEKGTEAAAANVFVVSEVTSLQYNPVFDANHPFSFYIMNKDDIVFTGMYNN